MISWDTKLIINDNDAKQYSTDVSAPSLLLTNQLLFKKPTTIL